MKTLRPTACAVLLLAVLGCATPAPAGSPLGAPLPRVTGETLAGRTLVLPDELAGAPAVLLVGFEHAARLDLKAWQAGLGAAGTPVRVVEVPCITGFFPDVMQGFIRDGMSGKLPPEQHDAVMPLFGEDAERLAARLGTDRPELGRVLLLDAQGVVRRLLTGAADPAALHELDAAARALAR